MEKPKTKQQPVCIGVDVGGTFTDVLLIDSFGRRWHVKVSSTPDDLSNGVLKGLQKALSQAHLKPSQVDYILHGTTAATNAVLQRKGAEVSLITTEGFEDILEIGRQQRPSLYDLNVSRCIPLVPRERCFGVKERVIADGRILIKLESKDAVKVVQKAGNGGKAVAVCLLYAYKNPTHEVTLGTLLEKFFPKIPVSLSSEVIPEFREYERISTTVLDAYVAPVLLKYVGSLEKGLKSIGVTAPLLMMQSHGGVLQSNLALKQAVRFLFSGLAGGALGGCYTSQILKENNLISFDMGGTSTDVSLITEGKSRETSEGNIGGLPCRVPMVDVETVGAGGGSIAWIDEGGVLRVGPDSAGADPGPCCYDRGGTNPTVTDANLLLGRLNQHYFLGGEVTLNLNLAEKAIRALGRRLHLSLEECAYGIIRIVNANMERAIRMVSIQRGYDPRDFALVAFGGAGPMHAWALARNLGIPRVIVPFTPGLHSALGLLATNLRCDQSQTVLQSTETPDYQQLRLSLRALESYTRKILHEQGVLDKQITIQRFADLRYEGQAYELTIPAPKGKLSKKWLKYILNEFHKLHQQQYGYATPNIPVTIVNLRVIASSIMPPLKPLTFTKQSGSPEPKETRPVFFEESGGYENTPIYERATLGLHAEIMGPAIIEQLDSTTIIHPNVKALVCTGGNIILEAIS
jgi:N-methylhydantoinase A